MTYCCHLFVFVCVSCASGHCWWKCWLCEWPRWAGVACSCIALHWGCQCIEPAVSLWKSCTEDVHNVWAHFRLSSLHSLLYIWTGQTRHFLTYFFFRYLSLVILVCFLQTFSHVLVCVLFVLLLVRAMHWMSPVQVNKQTLLQMRTVWNSILSFLDTLWEEKLPRKFDWLIKDKRIDWARCVCACIKSGGICAGARVQASHEQAWKLWSLRCCWVLQNTR